MKLLRISRQKNTAIMLAVFALCAVLPAFAGTYTIFLSTKIMIYVLICMQYIFLAGYGGMTSFAHISFYGLAGYALSSATVLFGMKYYPALLLAFMLTLIVVLVYALIAVRTNGKYFMMMSIAFCQLIYLSAIQWVNLTKGINGIVGVEYPTVFGMEISGRKTIFYFTLIVLAVCYFAEKRIVNSPFGIALQGVRDNERKMAALGFNTKLQRYMAIVLSAMFSAVAGWLSTIYYRGIAPESVALSMGTVVIFVAIIGGARKLEGAFVGALIYVVLEDISSSHLDRYKMLIGIFFIFVVLFMDKGILGIDFKNVRKLFRKKNRQAEG